MQMEIWGQILWYENKQVTLQKADNTCKNLGEILCQLSLAFGIFTESAPPPPHLFYPTNLNLN